MKVLLYIYFLLLIFCLPIAAQQEQMTGIVLERGLHHSRVAFASVSLLNVADSSIVQATMADTAGIYFMKVKRGKYMLSASFMGYKTAYSHIDVYDHTKVDTIYMDREGLLLDEAVVKAKVPDIVVKGDTIEYNADAYTTESHSVLQDLIKKIPGIEVDASGNISANGKPVRKILVDGKEFFDNDIALALNNLPANMVKKLQLFKEQSDESKITGFKDKDPDQVLNLQVKEELKRSMFGDVRLGYGNNGKYSDKVMGNYMQDKIQASVIGNINNVPSDSYMNIADGGVDKNRNTGANVYLTASDKFKVGTNARYSDNDNLYESTSETQTFLNSGDRFSEQMSNSNNRRKTFNTGLNLEWKPDSMTTILARSYTSFTNSKNRQNSSSLSYVVGKDTTSGFSENNMSGDGLNTNNYLTIGRKLNDKGRTLSLSLNQTYRKDDQHGTNYSETNYSTSVASRIIDQRIDTKSRSEGYGFSLSYVEPSGKDNLLQFSYNYGQETSKRNRNTWKKDALGEYTEIDSAYTRNTENKYITQNFSVNFQSTKEKYTYTVGFSVDPSSSRSLITLGDSTIERTKQDVVNFSPSLYFRYSPTPSTNLDVSYSGNTTQPSISQLSADTTIVSALSKYYGNPDLKPSYRNNLNVYYQKSDYETGRFMMLSGGIQYTVNNIVSYSSIDDTGNSLNTYRNVGGDMSSNLGLSYNTPLRNKKFKVNTGTYTNYYRNVGFTNGDKSVTHNLTFIEQASIKFQSDKFETDLRTNISHSRTKNNLSNVSDQNTTTYSIANSFLIKLPLDFSINSNIQYSRYVGYGEGFKKSEILWNTSIAKNILKDKKGVLKLELYDILKDRNNLSRIVTSNYISDSRSNTLSRYIMFSFTYRFNLLKGSSSDTDTYLYE